MREEKILPLEEAIRKMTSLPVQKLGLMGRGLIREGGWADVVVFDPNRVMDKATHEDPHRYPEGIEYALVNGEVVVAEEEHTGALCGKVLRISKGANR